MLDNNLPQGWRNAKVSELFQLVKDKITPNQEELHKYIGLEHLKSGGGIESIGSSEQLKSTKGVFKKGDLLYGKLRPYLNKHSLVDFDGICSTDIIILRTDNQLLTKYLDFFLNTKEFIQYANYNSKGINLPRISPKFIANAVLPIPPASELNNIVAKLDALLGRVSAVRERLDRVPDLLGQFRQSVLARAVSGELTREWREENPEMESAEKLLLKLKNKKLELVKQKMVRNVKVKITDISKIDFSIPEKWTMADLWDIANIIDPNPSHRMPEYYSEGLPFISTENLLGNGGIDFSKGKKVSIKTLEEQNARFKIKKGDFLFTRIGTIGKTCFLPIKESYCLSHAVCIISSYLPAILSPKFLNFVVQSEFILHQGLKGVKSVGVPDLGMGKIRAFQIPFPPTEEQHEIVRRVEALFAIADRMEERYEVLRAQVETLPQAILAKAFRGELVDEVAGA